jgi:hypothetical protein
MRPENSIDMAAWPVCSWVITSGEEKVSAWSDIAPKIVTSSSSAWTDSGESSVGVAVSPSYQVPPSEVRIWLYAVDTSPAGLNGRASGFAIPVSAVMVSDAAIISSKVVGTSRPRSSKMSWR